MLPQLLNVMPSNFIFKRKLVTCSSSILVPTLSILNFFHPLMKSRMLLDTRRPILPSNINVCSNGHSFLLHRPGSICTLIRWQGAMRKNLRKRDIQSFCSRPTWKIFNVMRNAWDSTHREEKG